MMFEWESSQLWQDEEPVAAQSARELQTPPPAAKKNGDTTTPSRVCIPTSLTFPSKPESSKPPSATEKPTAPSPRQEGEPLPCPTPSSQAQGQALPPTIVHELTAAESAKIAKAMAKYADVDPDAKALALPTSRSGRRKNNNATRDSKDQSNAEAEEKDAEPECQWGAEMDTVVRLEAAASASSSTLETSAPSKMSSVQPASKTSETSSAADDGLEVGVDAKGVDFEFPGEEPEFPLGENDTFFEDAAETAATARRTMQHRKQQGTCDTFAGRYPPSRDRHPELHAVFLHKKKSFFLASEAERLEKGLTYKEQASPRDFYSWVNNRMEVLKTECPELVSDTERVRRACRDWRTSILNLQWSDEQLEAKRQENRRMEEKRKADKHEEEKSKAKRKIIIGQEALPPVPVGPDVPDVAKDILQQCQAHIPDVPKDDVLLEAPIPDVANVLLEAHIPDVAQDILQAHIPEVPKDVLLEAPMPKDVLLEAPIPDVAKDVLLEAHIPDVAKDILQAHIPDMPKDVILEAPIPDVANNVLLEADIPDVPKDALLEAPIPDVAIDVILKAHDNSEAEAKVSDEPSPSGAKPAEAEAEADVEEPLHKRMRTTAANPPGGNQAEGDTQMEDSQETLGFDGEAEDGDKA